MSYHIVFLNSEVQHCQVLSDDKKRAMYDQYGEAGVKSTVGGGSSAYTVLHLLVYSFFDLNLLTTNRGEKVACS